MALLKYCWDMFWQTMRVSLNSKKKRGGVRIFFSWGTGGEKSWFAKITHLFLFFLLEANIQSGKSKLKIKADYLLV